MANRLFDEAKIRIFRSHPYFPLIDSAIAVPGGRVAGSGSRGKKSGKKLAF